MPPAKVRGRNLLSGVCREQTPATMVPRESRSHARFDRVYRQFGGYQSIYRARRDMRNEALILSMPTAQGDGIENLTCSCAQVAALGCAPGRFATSEGTVGKARGRHGAAPFGCYQDTAGPEHDMLLRSPAVLSSKAWSLRHPLSRFLRKTRRQPKQAAAHASASG